MYKDISCKCAICNDFNLIERYMFNHYIIQVCLHCECKIIKTEKILRSNITKSFCLIKHILKKLNLQDLYSLITNQYFMTLYHSNYNQLCKIRYSAILIDPTWSRLRLFSFRTEWLIY